MDINKNFAHLVCAACPPLTHTSPGKPTMKNSSLKIKKNLYQRNSTCHSSRVLKIIFFFFFTLIIQSFFFFFFFKIIWIVSRYDLAIHQSLCAHASMCYRSVQASTIYSYQISLFFVYTLTTISVQWKDTKSRTEKKKKKRISNICHFH